MTKITNRMKELMKPLEQQIMMCDDREDVLMLACAMLDKVKTILDSQIGEAGRRDIIESANKK
tara:strand:+ start:1923 stop:2111 length:189 start_codon:yes stop_codon:yes gene_type:complete